MREMPKDRIRYLGMVGLGSTILCVAVSAGVPWSRAATPVQTTAKIAFMTPVLRPPFQSTLIVVKR